MNGECGISATYSDWGVSILEAADEFDAGPICASHEFAVEENPPAKSSLYRGQVTEAAVRGVLEAVARIESGAFRSGASQPDKLTDVAPFVHSSLRPPMRQADRAIDWMRDTTAMIVRTIRAADSAPGVLGTLLGKSCFLYGAHEEERLQGRHGQILARRDGANCIGTVDGAVWISQGQDSGGALPPRSGGDSLRALRYRVLLSRRDQIAGDAHPLADLGGNGLWGYVIARPEIACAPILFRWKFVTGCRAISMPQRKFDSAPGLLKKAV